MSRQGVCDPRVVRLLRQDLPRMQPSALKHEYLAAVANVLRHPIASVPDDPTGADPAVRIIGFGDVHRTLPLSLIVEGAPDSTVRHAFVPSPLDPRDAELLAALQEHEDRWAAERGARRRDIAGQIRHRGRADVNRHGINHYEPRTPFTKADVEKIMAGGWYPAAPLPAHLEVDHPGRPDLDGDTLDRARLEDNVSASAQAVAGRREERVLRATLKPGQQRRLLLERLDAHDPIVDPQDGPEY